MQTKQLEGKLALITGASKGLGKTMAIALGSAGARLALVSRDLKQLKIAADAVKETGASAEVFQADVTNEDQVRALEADVAKRSGKGQILINNAGINIRKQLTEFSLCAWRQVTDTNLTGVFLMCRAFVPHMKVHAFGRSIYLT